MVHLNDNIIIMEGQTQQISINPDPVPLSFVWSVQNGTAKSGIDFNVTEAPRSHAGEKTLTLNIEIEKDAVAEERETFVVNVYGSYEHEKDYFTYTIYINDRDLTKLTPAQVKDLSKDEMMEWALAKGAKAYPEDVLLSLDVAQHYILQVRNLDSTNANARDAEYYIIGAHAGYSHDPYETVLVLGTPVYNTLKGIANLIGAQSVMQADPGKLNAAPGGNLDAYRGLIDGYSADHNQRLEIYERGASLPREGTHRASASDTTFTYHSELDFHANQQTTIQVHQTSSVPRDNTGRIIVDHDYSHSLVLGSGNDFVSGGSGNNINDGGKGNDIIFGLGGQDKLIGGDGNDVLDGGNGKDVLMGGKGVDILYGGASNDTFVYKTVGDSAPAAASRDMIEDFNVAQHDRIDLQGIDANSKIGGNQGFSFISSHAFGHHAGELQALFIGSNTLVSGDVNGDAKADFTISLTGHVTLHGSDFIL